MLAHERQRRFRQVRIERAAQTFIGSDQDQQVTLIAALVE